METQGRIAVITGGASGIGRGMANAFAAAGMKLVLADLDDDRLAAAAQELTAAGTEVVTTRCDVSKLEEVEALAQTALDRFGKVHALCNNAGIGLPTPTHNIKLEDWRWMIDVDLWGPIYGVKTFLPLIESHGEGGHLNSTASMAGLVSSPMMAAYNVAKHGVVALMATLERDLRVRKSVVRASVLCPGPINTNISRNSVQYRPSKAKPKADGAAEGKAGSAIQSMLESGMHPDDVGNLVLDAVQRDSFWVLTHPEMMKLVTRQFGPMLEDGTLTRA